MLVIPLNFCKFLHIYVLWISGHLSYHGPSSMIVQFDWAAGFCFGVMGNGEIKKLKLKLKHFSIRFQNDKF